MRNSRTSSSTRNGPYKIWLPALAREDPAADFRAECVSVAKKSFLGLSFATRTGMSHSHHIRLIKQKLRSKRVSRLSRVGQKIIGTCRARAGRVSCQSLPCCGGEETARHREVQALSSPAYSLVLPLLKRARCLTVARWRLIDVSSLPLLPQAGPCSYSVKRSTISTVVVE